MQRVFERLLAALLLAFAVSHAIPVAAQATPTLLGATSRKVHGAAGALDLALDNLASNPTTEPRLGPAHTIVFTFDGTVTAGTASITEGTATAGTPTFNGAELTVPLTGVSNAQYVTVTVSNVSTSGGGTGGSGSIRIGFLAGDVNGSRVVTVADLGLVNAALAQLVTAANFLKDVNASGTLTVADKGLTNARLTQALPSPGDAAPLVVSTVPTNNATGVASGSNITIQFSEPVSVSGNWFQVACTSGTLTQANTTVSGDLGPSSGTTFTLNPNAAFTFGDVCAATLFASGISDNDALDPPDHPAADFSFTFTVSASDAVPLAQNDSAATQPGTAVQFNVLANDSDADLDPLVIIGSSQGANGSVTCLANGSCTYTPNAGFSGIDTFTYTVSDGHGGQATGSAVVTVLPSDPSLTAPPLDLTVATTVDQVATFLYSGANPVQTGVTPGAVQATRASILRGRVLKRDGTPLPGAVVTILANTQFGQTLSRANGAYDMAVNGARYMTLNYSATGFLSAQRQVQVPWQGFVNVPDVALVPLDTQVTSITANAGVMQVHQGSLVSDADGSRKATILFPAGTMATMVLPDGSTQPLPVLDVRATEYTVGSNGPQAMPGELPGASAYTYAVELSADQALAAGATTVNFNQPVILYLENFLGFAAGTVVPVGTYDRVAGRWVPEPNGRVVKIISITGGAADLDVTGDGIADTGTALTDLGITPAELQQLAALYAPGQSLWRVPKTHFTAEDCNWPWVPADDAKTPPEAGADVTPQLPEADTCEAEGSIIECQNQVLGERTPIVGTGYTLNYRSDRVPAKLDVLDINVSGAAVPASLNGIDVRVDVGGQQQSAQFPGAANQKWSIYGNHADVYGRPMQGAQPYRVTISYSYPGHYVDPGDLSPILRWFGRPGIGIQSVGVRGSGNVAVAHTYTGTLGEGIHDARPFGLGGWMLDVHHFYDFTGKALYTGDGGRTRASALGRVISTIGGTGAAGFAGNNVPALQATVDPGGGMGIGPDGTIYFCNYSIGTHQWSLLRKIGPGGIISTVAGSSSFDGFNGDNILAVNAHLTCLDVVVGPDFSIYLNDLVNRRVRRIRPNNTITTVAGNGLNALGADDVAATSTSVIPHAIALGPEGNLYIAENISSVTGGASLTRIRRVAPDGMISTVLACPTSSCGTSGMVTGPDGSLYYSDKGASASLGGRIKRLRPDGTISLLAGSGICQFGTDGIANGVPASQANLCVPAVHAVDSRGIVYLSDSNSPQLATVTTDGLMTVLGGLSAGTLADGALARDAKLDVVSVRLGHEGALYVTTRGISPENARVRRITDPLPGYLNAGFVIASRDGREIYTFDALGRHLETRHPLTNSVLRSFAYDAAGRLSTVTEKTGGTDNVTTIQHDAGGNPTKIIGPYGQQTLLAVDAGGFLSAVTNPANEKVQMTSSPGGSLLSFTDPRGGIRRYSYNAAGALVAATDPTGAVQTLVRTPLAGGFSVARTSPLGRVTTYKSEVLAGGDRKQTVLSPGGESTDLLAKSDGTLVRTRTDGTVITTKVAPDPRFGMQVPHLSSLQEVSPNALTKQVASTLSATLSDPADPLSLVSLTRTTTTNGRLETSAYTASTRTNVTTSGQGRISTVIIDSLGRLLSSQRTGLNATSVAYDSRGRIATMTMGAGGGSRVTQLNYDANGNVQSVIDSIGRTTQYSRDAAGRVTSKTSPDGRVTSYAFDAAGNLASAIPPGRPATLFQYSSRDELTRDTPPAVTGGGPTTFAFDADRGLVDSVRPDNRSVKINYDSAGRPASRQLKTGAAVTDTDTVTHDASGRIATIAAASGATSTYGYDGALVLSEATSGAVSGTVATTFDPFLRVASRSVNGANAVAMTYDGDDLVTSAGTLTIARDPQHGLATGSTLGSVTSSLVYSGFGEPMQYTVTAASAPAFGYTVTRDGLGRIAQKVETVGGVASTFVYAYDTAGRLASVTRNGAPFESYGYDSNGNRTSATTQGVPVTATYDAQDRLVQYGGTTYVFSAAGDLQQKTAGGQTTTYQYDQQRNLRSVNLPGGTAVSYVIDGNDRRVGKRVNGTLTRAFLYNDSLRPLAELDGAGNVVSRFVFARGSTAAYMTKGGATYRIVTDQAGSVRLVIDAATGTIMQRIDYDSFGNVLQDTNPGFQPFGFAGGLYDPDTGLVRFGARDYDPAVGRWTAKDPAGLRGGDVNVYGYVRNDPVNRIDPAGYADVGVAVPEPSVDSGAVIADIIQILVADPDFVNRTDSVFKYLPRPGDVRNGLLLACYIGYLGLLCAPDDPFAAYYVCSGIADQADKILKQAIADGKLPGVVSAESHGRKGILGTDHQALFVTLNDGTTIVLDWHATLDPEHPLVSTPEQWCMGHCL